MQKAIKYVIFKTKWGYFGLSGNECGLLQTCLPLGNPEKVESRLLTPPLRQGRGLTPRFEKRLFKKVQDQITAYFEGVCVNFSPDIPVVLDGLGHFCRAVLTACRDIKFGQTVSYLELAKKLGRPNGARAIGNALAKNPLPLIIPCHRVIRSDGKIGGFSAPGGKSTKVKLLEHESYTLMRSKCD